MLPFHRLWTHKIGTGSIRAAKYCRQIPNAVHRKEETVGISQSTYLYSSGKDKTWTDPAVLSNTRDIWRALASLVDYCCEFQPHL